MKFKIKDRSGGAASTGIVIRRYGIYINVVPDEKALRRFLADNLPSGIYGRDGKGCLSLVPGGIGNSLQLPRDLSGDVIPIDVLASGLGYSFEKIDSARLGSTPSFVRPS